jgi:FKBP-type peptidyl-prolyl cis-trans isomerase FkpA
MKYKIILKLIVAVMFGAVLLTGCFDNDIPSAEEILQTNLDGVDKTKLESDLKIIDDSLQRWHLLAEKEPNGVRYIIHSQGTGPKPKLRSIITFNYQGRLLSNNSVFDGNSDGTTAFSLDQLIIGWQTTLPLLNEGGRITLYIPSGYGYGPIERKDLDGNVVIPANANLIFEIELLDVR